MVMSEKSANRVTNIFKAKEFGLFMILVVLSILIGIRNPIFFSFHNIIDIFRNTSYTLIIAVGMTFVLVAKGLDLSVGSMIAICGMVCALFLSWGYPIFFCILTGLLTGAAFGAINALCIVVFHIPSMIATLGCMYMARGLVLVVTKGAPVYPLPKEFVNLGTRTFFGVPFIVVLSFIICLVAHFVLNNTTYGRRIYAIGGNIETAKYAGINVAGTTASVYIISGVLAALSGIMTSARMGSGQPSVGDGTEMTVITAVIIGGTSLNGGVGTILGTALGALLTNVLSTGMNLVGISAYWQKFVTGLIIIVAVGIDQYQRRKVRS